MPSGIVRGKCGRCKLHLSKCQCPGSTTRPWAQLTLVSLPDLQGVLDEKIDSARDRRPFDWKRAVAKGNGYRGRP
jgi:hypothetical protein